MKSLTRNISTLLLIILFFIDYIHAYDPSLALKLAYMSAIAYQPIQLINSWTCYYCYLYETSLTKAFYVPEKSIQGFITYLYYDNTIIVAFRGSEDIKNWVVNLDILKDDYPDCQKCKVHSGFYNAYKAISTQMKNQIAQILLNFPGAHILVTGHSLGGALSHLAALDITKNFNKVGDVYTFGSPRVGNQQFSKYISSKINGFRVIHYADIVVHVPPNSFSFDHQFPQIWYSEDMKKYEICQPQNDCANSIFITSYSIDDHDLQKHYLKILTTRKWYRKLYDTLLLSKMKIFSPGSKNKIQIREQCLKVKHVKLFV